MFIPNQLLNLQQQFSDFGSVPGARRRPLSPEEFQSYQGQLRQEVADMVALDNTPADKDPAPGRIHEWDRFDRGAQDVFQEHTGWWHNLSFGTYSHVTRGETVKEGDQTSIAETRLTRKDNDWQFLDVRAEYQGEVDGGTVARSLKASAVVLGPSVWDSYREELSVVSPKAGESA